MFFSGSTDTGCGLATADVGPFYCPADQKVYVDLGFFQELQARFGAEGGPFARHTCSLTSTGTTSRTCSARWTRSAGDQQGPQSAAVRSELQADCFAGVWAATRSTPASSRSVSDAEIADALDAAESVGDDRIQQETQGQVIPETWTHGSSAQRQQWFLTGYQSGDPNACDTFSGRI